MMDYDIPGAARLLDRHGPREWYNVINTDTLDMEAGRRCILGQLYGDYYIVTIGDRRLPWLPDNNTPIRNAFTGFVPTEEWIHEIMKRRNGEMNNPRIGENYDVTFRGRLVTIDEDDPSATYEFQFINGYRMWFSRGELTSITPVPWETKEGDVYRVDGVVYEIKSGMSYRTGSTTPAPGAHQGFSEDTLIYREDS